MPSLPTMLLCAVLSKTSVVVLILTSKSVTSLHLRLHKIYLLVFFSICANDFIFLLAYYFIILEQKMKIMELNNYDICKADTKPQQIHPSELIVILCR